MRQLQDKLDDLLNHYEQDLETYRQILLETEKTEARWSEETQHSESSASPGVATGLSRNDKANQVRQAENADGTDNADSVSVQAADQAVGETEALISWRKEKLQAIDQRRAKTETTREAICTQLGITTIDTTDVLRVYPQLHDRWHRTMTELKEKATKVKESNERLIKQLQMEMEYLKLEMHRMQGLQKSRQVYGISPAVREARFIDKNR